MGRGTEHFFGEGIKLENVTGDDPYRELARQALTIKSETASTADSANLFS